MPKITRHGGVSDDTPAAALSEPETAEPVAPEPEEADAPEKPGRHERARDDES